MENNKTPIGIEEIRNIKMSTEEKNNILLGVLSAPIPESSAKPIKSPYSFVSFFQRNHLAFYVTAMCLILIILGGGATFNYLQNTKNGNLAKVDTGGISIPSQGNIGSPATTPLAMNTNNKNVTPSTGVNNNINNNPVGSSVPPPSTGVIAQNTNNGNTSTATSAVGTRAPTTATMAPSAENQAAPITLGLKKAFNLYKNGQISECVLNGQIYYSAALNADDGGGQTFDVNGNKVGEYQGFTGIYTGINPENCTIVYVVSPNIWGLKALNKYNLK
jgi:hypothetical protein